MRRRVTINPVATTKRKAQQTKLAKYTPASVKADIESPTRKHLTAAQYYKWACGLRELRQYGVPKATRLSLNAQTNLLYTIKVNRQYWACKALSASFQCNF